MLNELSEIIVNFVEPVLLFTLLKGKLKLKRHSLPFAFLCIFLLAGATTIMNKLQLDYIATIIISLTLYVVFSFLLFKGEFNLRAVWPSLMIYIMVFSNTILFAVMSAISEEALIVSLQPSTLRILVQTVYVSIMLLMVLLVLSVTKSMDRVSSKIAAGALLSCLISIGAMYLLLNLTIIAAESRIATIKYGVIALLMTSVVLLLLVMFGQTNKWIQKFADERVVSESLKREVRYNSEMTTVSKTVRQLKHDYANHMSVIASMAADGNLEGLRKYMTDYNSEYGAVERYAITGDNTLDSLLSYKKMLCDAEWIEFNITAVGNNLRNTGLSEVEISSLFGNLIDNAMNACRKLEPEKRKITLSIRKMADMMRIQVENNRIVSEAEKREEDPHGLGLPRIKSIVEAHDGVCTIMPEEDRFIVEILLSTVKMEGDGNEA